MQVKGKALQKKVAAGSKSERVAVLLQTKRGEYVMQRVGAHPFQDEVLEGLVGRDLVCEGEVLGNTLLVKGWDVIDEEGQGSPTPRKK